MPGLAPGYAIGRGIKDKQAETLTYVDSIVLAEKSGVDILFDPESQSPHFKYDGGEVWFEDNQSTAAKLDVVAK